MISLSHWGMFPTGKYTLAWYDEQRAIYQRNNFGDLE
jgi:hypothetical protein